MVHGGGLRGPPSFEYEAKLRLFPNLGEPPGPEASAKQASQTVPQGVQSQGPGTSRNTVGSRCSVFAPLRLTAPRRSSLVTPGTVERSKSPPRAREPSLLFLVTREEGQNYVLQHPKKCVGKSRQRTTFTLPWLTSYLRVRPCLGECYISPFIQHIIF